MDYRKDVDANGDGSLLFEEKEGGGTRDLRWGCERVWMEGKRVRHGRAREEKQHDENQKLRTVTSENIEKRLY